jgi:chitinase
MKRAIVPLALVLAGCRTLSVYQPPDPPRYRVIAYVRGKADISRIGAEKLTHVNYAFAHVSPEGEVVLNDPDAPSHLAQLQALKARNPRLRLLLSVGGWGADGFSDAALTDQSRETFALSAVAAIERYALDGIDLDWEYPGQPGPGIEFRPEDKENFTALLAAMRKHLDFSSAARNRRGYDRYALTIASSGGRYFEHTEMEKLHVHLDWINVMTYDFYTPGSATTGHHTALYSSGSPWSAHAFVEQHLAAGIPPRKLVLGAAFYGRAFAGANRENEGLLQPYERYAGDYPYSRILAEVLNRSPFVRRWDRQAKAPYLWNEETTTFISYDDPDSLREKARYVKRRGLGGIMYWEHSHDPAETLLDVLWKALGS